MNKPLKLSDSVGVIGFTSRQYPDKELFTSIRASHLREAADLVETLGWKTVDLYAEANPEDDDEPGLLIIQPPPALFVEQTASLCVAPRTNKGRGETDD